MNEKFRKIVKESERRFIESLPLEEKLRDIKLEERLMGLAPEDLKILHAMLSKQVSEGNFYEQGEKRARP